MLTKLELRNFKSHRHTEFNFDDSRLHAIVGQNSSGKTSVLQALIYLGQLSELKNIKNYYPHTEYQQEIQNAINKIGRENTTFDSNDLALIGSGSDWLFSFVAHRHVDTSNDIWIGKRSWKNNKDELKDDNIDRFFTLKYNIKWTDDLTSIFHAKLIAINLSRAAYSENIIPEIEPDGSGLAPALDYLKNEYPDRFQSLQEMLQQIVPSVRKVGTRRAKVNIERSRTIEVDGKKIFYEENQEVIGQEIFLDMATGDRIPASEISEGTMLTLGLLTVLMNPEQPNLVLLDDIEQGLHPKAQLELITVVKQIIQANPKLQIIFTTHSPYIIDELEPSQVYVLSNAKDGFTRAQRLDEHSDIEWAKQTLTTGEFWDAVGEDWVVEADVND